jgi:hypothetical protein
VVTANALAYALEVKVKPAYLKNDKLIIKKERVKSFSKYNIVEPEYSGEPNIT